MTERPGKEAKEKMRLSEKDYEYLKGDKFSSLYDLKLEDNLLYSRIEQIIRIVSGTSVLHIGCCDHVPLIEKKIQQNLWLHGLLDKKCKDVLGVDISKEAVEFVNAKKLAREKVYYADVTSEDFIEKVPKKDLEYVFLGEIVEHLDNPVSFLTDLKSNMQKYGFNGRYIITVPNAVSFLKKKKLRGGIESINSDHRYWFTPYTICKVMMQSGICPEEILFSSNGRGGNGSNQFTNRFFAFLEKIRKQPSGYKSYRGDSMIVIGK